MMKRFTAIFPVIFLILTLASCDSAEKRQHAVATPPPAVTAPTLVAPAPPPPQPTPPPPPQQVAPAPDPVAQLIAAVEKEYQAGQANYSAGHLEAAKQNFDHAFNLLTGSKLDVQNDPRLQQEFDK